MERKDNSNNAQEIAKGLLELIRQVSKEQRSFFEERLSNPINIEPTETSDDKDLLAPRDNKDNL